MPAAHEPGRNDPCSCGSGRKYKHCCLTARAREATARRAWREAEGRVVPDLMEYALTRWGAEFMAAAWAEFFLWENVPENFTDSLDFDTVFIPWLLFHYVTDPELEDLPPEWPQETIARHFLRHTLMLDPADRRYIEQAGESPFSFFVVTGTVPGRQLALRDVLTGREFTVLEQSASETLEPGALLFSTVVSFDGAAILLGCAPYVIPASWHNRIIDLREQLNRAGRLERPDLFEFDLELRSFYRRINEALLNPRRPQIANTDGDPFELTTLEYELDCDIATTCERLRPLTLAGPDGDLLESAERDESGALSKVELAWMKKGNRKHRDWDNTVLGHIAVTPGRLVAEVNSARRARRLERELKKLLGADGVLMDEKVTTQEEMFARRDPGQPREPERPEPEPPPELQEYMREYAARHWEAWLDEKIPALGNRTPRQAAKTPLGRERLEALLAEYAWHESHGRGGLPVDFPELRRKLGLQPR